MLTSDGPSIPLMFGINERPKVLDNKLQPLERYGVKVMSIGFLVDPMEAVIWRGPMASGAVKQFMSDVNWGDLDYLIFDLPPGYRRHTTYACTNNSIDRCSYNHNTAGCGACRCEEGLGHV